MFKPSPPGPARSAPNSGPDEAVGRHPGPVPTLWSPLFPEGNTRPRIRQLKKLTGRSWGLEERQLRVVAQGYIRGAMEHAAAA